MSTWFARALRRWMESNGFPTQSAAADALGVKRLNFHRWLSGSIPEEAEELLRRMGGDIERAMPGWVPIGSEEASTVSVIGRVRRDDSVEFVASPVTANTGEALFRSSPFWPKTFGPIRYIVTDRESLDPGTVMAIRATTADLDSLPAGGYIIVQSNSSPDRWLLCEVHINLRKIPYHNFILGPNGGELPEEHWTTRFCVLGSVSPEFYPPENRYERISEGRLIAHGSLAAYAAAKGVEVYVDPLDGEEWEDPMDPEPFPPSLSPPSSSGPSTSPSPASPEPPPTAGADSLSRP